MTDVDWIIVAAVAFSVLLGVLRGIVRELVALAGWIAAVVLALNFADEVGAWLPLPIDWPALRVGLGALLIVVTTVLIASAIGWIARKLLAAAKLSSTDRALGAAFGVLRAAVVAFVLVFFTHDTAIGREPWWQSSLLLPPLAATVRLMAPYIPDPLKALPSTPSLSPPVAKPTT